MSVGMNLFIIYCVSINRQNDSDFVKGIIQELITKTNDLTLPRRLMKKKRKI